MGDGITVSTSPNQRMSRMYWKKYKTPINGGNRPNVVSVQRGSHLHTTLKIEAITSVITSFLRSPSAMYGICMRTLCQATHWQPISFYLVFSKHNWTSWSYKLIACYAQLFQFMPGTILVNSSPLYLESSRLHLSFLAERFKLNLACP